MAGNGSRAGSSRGAGGKTAAPFGSSQALKRVNTEATYRAADRMWSRMNQDLPSPTTTAYKRMTPQRAYMFRERMSERLRRNWNRATLSR